MSLNVIIIVIVLLCSIGKGRASNETIVMLHISETIGGYVWECRKQISFSGNIIEQFLSYWDEHTALQDLHMGCVVNCVLEKLQLIGPGGVLEVANADAFTKANGADGRISSALIHLYQMCKNITKFEEPCRFGLEISRCFRAGVLMLKWDPDLVDPDADYIHEDE